MAKYKIINIEIYKRDITVFIGSHNEFQQWVANYNAPNSWEQLIESIITSEDNAVGSYWYNNENGNGIIELSCHPQTPFEISVAAHECLHCAFHILSYIGIPVTEHGANEAYTYLLEYILYKVLSFDDYNLINI